jgi:hypothetical protein
MSSNGFGVKSDLSRTSFGTTPIEGLEVIDAYNDTSFSAFGVNTTAITTSITDEFPGIKPNLINAMSASAATMAFINKSDYANLNDAVKALSRVLPSSVSVNAVLEKFGLEDALTYATKMFSGEDKWNFDLRHTVSTYLDEMQKTISAYIEFDKSGAVGRLASLINVSNISKWFPITAFGESGTLEGQTGTSDFITALIKKYGYSKMYIDSGTTDGLVEWVSEDEFLPASSKQWLASELTIPLGEAGAWEELSKAIAYAGSRFTPTMRILTIRAILTGYSYSSTVTNADKPALATDLIDRLMTIDTQWYSRDRNGTITLDLRHFPYASYDALDVLFFDTRTRSLSCTYKAYTPEPEAFYTIAKDHYKYLVV